MMDFPPSLMPDDAPEPGACVRLERPEPGLAVLYLEPPHRKKAVLDVPLIRDLATLLDKLAQDSGLRGLVITGREPTNFAVGADLEALARLDDPVVSAKLASFGQSVFSKIAGLRATTIAAVGGPVPGGAFELSLACDRIVACNDKSTRIGLPETQLGILPGWGGSQRLPRRVGIPTALQVVLTGKLYPVRQAKKLGLVDRLTDPEYLVRVACEAAMGRQKIARRQRGVWTWLVDRNPLALSQIRKKVAADVQKKTGGHYPAPPRAMDLVLRAPRTPLEQGLAREATALGELSVTPVCKNLVAIFRMSEEAKKLGRMPDGSAPREIRRAGVVGAGIMGGSIAGLLAERGVDARLGDLQQAALDAAVLAHRARAAKAEKRRRILPHEARASIDRLETVQGIVGFQRCDLVVEAVAERLDVKRKVLAEVAAQTGPKAILATNTSSLSVDEIAAGLERPERVVGMHFFNPVHRMPLVEIIRGTHTTDEVVAATAKLAVGLGKTPVVVKDVAGFLVNRLLGPYLDEAARFLSEGVPPERIDADARSFGMPMGPLELIDEVGLDIAAHAAESLEAAYGERMASSPTLKRMLDAGLTGKKGGAGFFLWQEDERSGRVKKLGPNPKLADYVGTQTHRPLEISDGCIVDQLLLAMINEAYLCLEEGVATDARAIDLATVFGMGFPPFRGGLMRYAEGRGARDLVSALRRVLDAPDVVARTKGRSRFAPAPSLLREVGEANGVKPTSAAV